MKIENFMKYFKEGSWNIPYSCDRVSDWRSEMHDEIFHFEKFKNFMEILNYFKNLKTFY